MANRKELQVLHGEGESLPCNFIFECTTALSNSNPNFNKVYEEFIEYKTHSDVNDELPAPSEDDQKDYESVVDGFGKDKPNSPHSSLSASHAAAQLALRIYHLHTFDGSRRFDKWQVNKQWLRVSNTFVIYSYFEHDGVNFFYVLDFVQEKGTDANPNGGHQALVNPVYINQWIRDARAYKTAQVQLPIPTKWTVIE